jgi:hypothetical protein
MLSILMSSFRDLGDVQVRRRNESDGGERVSTNNAFSRRRAGGRGGGDMLSLVRRLKPNDRTFHGLLLLLRGEVMTGDGQVGGKKTRPP